MDAKRYTIYRPYVPPCGGCRSEKGMVTSVMGDPTPERGGRRKRLFQVTAYGRQTLHDIQAVRATLWGMQIGKRHGDVGYGRSYARAWWPTQAAFSGNGVWTPNATRYTGRTCHPVGDADRKKAW